MVKLFSSSYNWTVVLFLRGNWGRIFAVVTFFLFNTARITSSENKYGDLENFPPNKLTNTMSLMRRINMNHIHTHKTVEGLAKATD